MVISWGLPSSIPHTKACPSSGHSLGILVCPSSRLSPWWGWEGRSSWVSCKHTHPALIPACWEPITSLQPTKTNTHPAMQCIWIQDHDYVQNKPQTPWHWIHCIFWFYFSNMMGSLVPNISDSSTHTTFQKNLLLLWGTWMNTCEHWMCKCKHSPCRRLGIGSIFPAQVESVASVKGTPDQSCS